MRVGLFYGRALSLLTVAGCLASPAVPCGDAVCPTGFACLVDRCVAEPALAACVGMVANDACTLGEGVDGTCDVDGVCIAAVCGDGARDIGEVCDVDVTADQTCVSEGHFTGVVGCADNCVLDTSACIDAGWTRVLAMNLTAYWRKGDREVLIRADANGRPLDLLGRDAGGPWQVRAPGGDLSEARLSGHQDQGVVLATGWAAVFDGAWHDVDVSAFSTRPYPASLEPDAAGNLTALFGASPVELARYDATARAFVSTGQVFAPLMDSLTWVGARAFAVHGDPRQIVELSETGMVAVGDPNEILFDLTADGEGLLAPGAEAEVGRLWRFDLSGPVPVRTELARDYFQTAVRLDGDVFAAGGDQVMRIDPRNSNLRASSPPGRFELLDGVPTVIAPGGVYQATGYLDSPTALAPSGQVASIAVGEHVISIGGGGSVCNALGYWYSLPREALPGGLAIAGDDLAKFWVASQVQIEVDGEIQEDRQIRQCGITEGGPIELSIVCTAQSLGRAPADPLRGLARLADGTGVAVSDGMLFEADLDADGPWIERGPAWPSGCTLQAIVAEPSQPTALIAATCDDVGQALRLARVNGVWTTEVLATWLSSMRALDIAADGAVFAVGPDGAAWASSAAGPWASAPAVRGANVSAVSAQDAWIVDGPALAYHWDGAAWSQVGVDLGSGGVVEATPRTVTFTGGPRYMRLAR